MTPTEIAAALLAMPHVTSPLTGGDEWAAFNAYHDAKRATGAPTSLEYAVMFAADRCRDTERHLRDYLANARREADEGLAALETHGSLTTAMWFHLNSRQNAEALADGMRVAREAFRDAVKLWAELADRIVATPEETAAAEATRAEQKARQREAQIARWLKHGKGDLSEAAAAHGLTGRSKRARAEALVDAGHVLEG